MSLLRFVFILPVLAIGLYYVRFYFAGCVCERNERLDGKTVLITGANTGIGLETAIDLSARGARVILACRDKKRCADARNRVINETGVAAEKVLTDDLDLSSLASIRAFADRFKAREPKLHILINNAGVMGPPYSETVDGFEMQIGVNHLGHFLLTHLLLDLIKGSAPSRIINVSSRAYLRGSMNVTDINLRGDDYGRFTAYSQSKLANVLHARELAKRLKGTGVTAVSLHPGAVATELGRAFPVFLQVVFRWATMLLVKTPWEGAQTSICCALDPNLDQHSGEYFSDCAPQELIPSGRDDDTAAALWRMSEKLVGI